MDNPLMALLQGNKPKVTVAPVKKKKTSFLQKQGASIAPASPRTAASKNAGSGFRNSLVGIGR